ncbi:MAG: threonylcarbamoyl-AMP synthase [Clostridia bacterium]|nr:threonylcarbamoyl-AMP synthase [Clostridia bacterium]
MNTLYLKAEEENTADIAGGILRGGGLVAIPTETVYGLAANAFDAAAVKKIFEAKGRPQDNPLIVHVQSLDEIPALVEKVDPRLPALAERFWPGPLTVIMKRSSLVPDEVTAGLDTVAIRMPSHPAARAVIAAAGVPLAAPSANASGRPSPTKAEHVKRDLDGRIDAVIDGGECQVGVESTVITLVTEPPTLLRPGGVTPEELRKVLGDIEVSHAVFEKLEEGEKAQSPGMKYKHYAPEAPVTIVKGSFEIYKKFVLAHREKVCAVCFDGEGENFECSLEFGREDDSAAQAHKIFDVLRRVDETGCSQAFVRCPSPGGVGLAVYNRLLRSAAFRVLDLDFTVPVYGLTGQTGAGKGYAGKILSELGMSVIDTDLVARQAVLSPEVIRSLKAAFGDDIYAGGVLDRGELARRAFSDEKKTRLLNSITHPEITRLTAGLIHEAEKSGARAAVIDAPVLFESPIAALCDKIICVTAPESVRIERIMRRDGISREQALLRIGAQRDEEYYKSKSDIIIVNDGKNDIKTEILNRKDLI